MFHVLFREILIIHAKYSYRLLLSEVKILMAELVASVPLPCIVHTGYLSHCHGFLVHTEQSHQYYTCAVPTTTSQNICYIYICLFRVFQTLHKAAICILLSSHCCCISASIKSIKECVVPQDDTLLLMCICTSWLW